MSSSVILSTPQVQQLQRDGKVTFRAPVKAFAHIDFIGAGGSKGSEWNDPQWWGCADEYGDYWTLEPNRCGDAENVLPRPYAVGDVVYVRETWQQVIDFNGWERRTAKVPTEGTGRLIYLATLDEEEPPRWRSSTSMPRWAARLWLEITGVQVERDESGKWFFIFESKGGRVACI